MRDAVASTVLLLGLCAGLTACGDEASQPLSFGTGASPKIPPPKSTLLPTVNIAPAVGWPAGGKPEAAAGLEVAAYARDLDHPRTILILPNGDVLVAETNGPQRPENNKGIKGWVTGLVQKRAGAGTPSANRITLLRGVKSDGSADVRTVFLQGLNSPFGMALRGSDLFIANTDAVLKFDYTEGQTEIMSPGVKIADLPAGPINHHWTKDLVISRDGAKLYVSVGSNSNIGENGLDKEDQRAAILEIDRATGRTRVYASGLRNANGLAWRPQTDELWAVVNERDELGSDLVPDYMTSVKDGGFYGWPFSYYGHHIDSRVKPERPDLVSRAIVPDYALGAHVDMVLVAVIPDRT